MDMTDRKVQLFFEIHSGLPRQGPGSAASTAKAFSLLKQLPPKPAILDVGCGPGMQTMDLARLGQGNITAIDNYQPFLDDLESRARDAGVADRVRTVNGDMNELAYPDESFDLIWAEGSIYQMGFENGLRSWQRLLKPGGYIAVTEVSWLKPNPPRECADFWNENYPQIQEINDNLYVISKCGYQIIDQFVLPPSDWWDDYYTQIERKLPEFERKYVDDEDARAVIGMELEEMSIHRKYADYYGYVFYVMRKPG